MLTAFSKWFWNPDVWLPPGFEWEDLVPNDKVKYPDHRDMVYAIPMAFFLIFVRFVVERTILIPVGIRMGLKNSNRVIQLESNSLLEKAYRKFKGKIPQSEITPLSKKTELEVRQVERWLRRRKAQDKHTKLSKFSECGWQWICYTTSFFIGLYVIWDKSWFLDIKNCWYDYPHHSIDNDVWWYYIFGAGCYLSLVITQFTDAKRKDFWEMFLHHLTTLTLIAFSWTCNFARVGTLVLVLHDAADVILSFAKMVKYTGYDRVCDVLFAIFTLIWIWTRLWIYPFHIMNSTLFDAPKIIPWFPVYYIFNGMLPILLLLHIFWTYYILKIVAKAIASGNTAEDARSSSESLSDLSDDSVKESKNK